MLVFETLIVASVIACCVPCQTAMRLHQKMLKGIDSQWVYDEAILPSIARATDSKLLLSWICRCTCKKNFTMHGAGGSDRGVEEFKFKGADLKFFPATLRQSREIAGQMLRRLHDGEVIMDHGFMVHTSTSPFHAIVAAVLGEFINVKCMMKSSPDFDAEKEHFKDLNKSQDKPLIMKVMEIYMKEARNPAALSELSVFSSVCHLLTTTDVDLITKLCEANRHAMLDGKDHPVLVVAALPNAKSKAKPKPANAETVQTAETLSNAALAILRMRKSS
eukprot:1321658-Amphidinium_carterae.3